jgi:hypothetical protein
VIVELMEVREPHARDFESVPLRLFGTGWPAWTPPLPGEERRLFDRGRNPALRGSEFARWVARRDGELAGRIAAFAPPPEAPADVGYFGFFDSVDDEHVSGMLFHAAEQWLVARGRRRLYGPACINLRDQIGLLVEGFGRPATLLTPWNPPYSVGLLQAAGFTAAVGLRSYAWTPDVADRRGVLDLCDRLDRRGRGGGVHLRPLQLRALQRETELIADLVNRSFGAMWGYVPIAPDEASDLAHQLRPIIDPAIIHIAEDERGPCGVALCLPDANWLTRAIGGRLWPFGWFRLLRLRHRIPWARCMALAVLPGRRATGIVARLMGATHRAWLARGYQYAELAQVFDDNAMMRRVIERMGLPEIRRYTVYTRQAAGGTA